MFRVVMRSLQKQIDQSNMSEDRSGINNIEVGSNSHANKVNTEKG
jgi:hypothetical protein